MGSGNLSAIVISPEYTKLAIFRELKRYSYVLCYGTYTVRSYDHVTYAYPLDPIKGRVPDGYYPPGPRGWVGTGG